MDKIKVMFVCTGNICRSPMAEFVFKDMVKKQGYSERFTIASAATSDEEYGNPVHPGTHRILSKYCVPEENHRAVKFTKDDYENYDLIVYMDEYNRRGLKAIIGEDKEKKLYRLLDFTDFPRDVADPWYTGDFQTAYEDIANGCRALLLEIINRNFKFN